MLMFSVLGKRISFKKLYICMYCMHVEFQDYFFFYFKSYCNEKRKWKIKFHFSKSGENQNQQ